MGNGHAWSFTRRSSPLSLLWHSKQQEAGSRKQDFCSTYCPVLHMLRRLTLFASTSSPIYRDKQREAASSTWIAAEVPSFAFLHLVEPGTDIKIRSEECALGC
jgi:hypothetical protein